MCYCLVLSTTSKDDLSMFNTDLVQFSRELPTISDTARLSFPYQWYIGSKSGCSCSFRHLYSIELGFGEPVEWYPEESDDIETTRQVVEIALTPGNIKGCTHFRRQTCRSILKRFLIQSLGSLRTTASSSFLEAQFRLTPNVKLERTG